MVVIPSAQAGLGPELEKYCRTLIFLLHCFNLRFHEISLPPSLGVCLRVEHGTDSKEGMVRKGQQALLSGKRSPAVNVAAVMGPETITPDSEMPTMVKVKLVTPP
jgi:hypothetical protein